VLEEVRHPDGVEVALGQVGVRDVGHHHLPAGAGGVVLVVGHPVHRPALLRGHLADELAESRGRIEHPLGTPELLMDPARDLGPDRLAGALVYPAEAVVVEAFVVHVETSSSA
jgi:hypothetical protein